MKRKSYIKEVVKLALPTTLGNIFTFLIGFTDHIMTSSLGKGAIGGIFLSNQIGIILQFIITGIEATVTVLGAREDAEGEARSFNKTLLLAFYSAGTISLLTTIVCTVFPKQVLSLFSHNSEIIDTGASFLRILAFSFIPFSISRIIMTALRAKKLPTPSLYMPLFTFLLNLGLNFLLIRSTKSSAENAIGAAAATLISRLFEVGLGIILFMKASKRRKTKEQNPFFIIPRENIILFCKTALPIMIGQTAWAANSLLTTVIMSRVGNGIATVSFGAASAVHNLAYTVMNGTSSAVGVLTARSVGEKRLSFSECRTAELTLIMAGVIGSVVILLLSPPILSLYHLGESDLALASAFSHVFAVSFLLTTYSAGTLFGVVKSSGDVTFVSRVDTLLFIFLTLPSSLIAYFGAATPTVTLAVLKLVDLVKCGIAHLYIIRRWKPPIDKVRSM